jgi:hypothetical protein
MNASIVVAICATVIAVLSLAVSIYEARAARRHNRISVRPFLALGVSLPVGGTAGLRLSNSGLGPAAITRTILAADHDQFLLSVRPFSRTEHAEFADLLRHRLGLCAGATPCPGRSVRR